MKKRQAGCLRSQGALTENILNFINNAAVVMTVGFELRKFFEQSSLFVRKVRRRGDVDAYVKIAVPAPSQPGHAFSLEAEQTAALSAFTHFQLLFAVERRHGYFCSERSLGK